MAGYCLVSHQLAPAIRRLLPRRTYVLGRDLGCEVPLPSEHVSRRHAEIQWHLSGGFVIRDLKSRNGTRVNGVPLVAAQLLQDGDAIALGPFSLRFRTLEGNLADLLGSELEGAETVGAEAIEAAAAGPGPTTRLAFGGAFSEHDLLEVCRVIAAGERTGTLTVSAAPVEGHLSFEKGEIRRARTADLQGLDAAHAILALESGRFEFVEGPVGLTPNCKIKAEPLILEVARRLDHAAPKEAEPGAPTDEGPAFAPFASDADRAPFGPGPARRKTDESEPTRIMPRPEGLGAPAAAMADAAPAAKDGSASSDAPLLDELPLRDEAPP